MNAASSNFWQSLRPARWGIGLLLLSSMVVLFPPPAQAQLSELFVESNVENATILFDGEEVGQTNEEGTAVIGALEPGEHTLEIQKAGYWSASTRVTLEPDLTTRVTLTLMPRPEDQGGSLLINTNVADAVVQVDGEQVGLTGPRGRAYTTGLAPGPHRVVVEKEGYTSASRTVSFDEPGLDRIVELRLMRGAATAETSTDEGDQGAEGSPQVEITAGGGLPDSLQTVTDTVPESARLGFSQLIVDAGVEGATISVNDSVYGRTEEDGELRVQMSPGDYQIAVRKDGFTSAQTAANLGAGEQRRLSLILKPAATAQAGPLEAMGDNLMYLFIATLLALTGIVAAFVAIAGWEKGVFTRWFRDSVRFDRYDVLDVLRRTEFTTVHLANDPHQNRQVALTVLDDPYADRPNHVQQFLNKGLRLQKIKETDPNAPVLEVYRVGRKNDGEDGRPFVAHEHLEGETLLNHLKEVGRLDTNQALATIRQICVGLQAAHDIGIHHGSVSPETIIVTQKSPEFKVKLIGFGLAASQPSTQVVTDSVGGSTAAYVAPEQLQNGQGSWRSDMYAVGMLFYKLVTGAPPYADDDPTRVMKRQQQEPRPDLPDSVPEYVKPVFYRMVSKEADRRPKASRVVSVLDLIQSAA